MWNTFRDWYLERGGFAVLVIGGSVGVITFAVIHKIGFAPTMYLLSAWFIVLTVVNLIGTSIELSRAKRNLK